MENRVCDYCGTIYKPTNYNQRFCCKNCAVRAHTLEKSDEIKIPTVEQGCDLKVGEISEIMQEFGISYTEYACNRSSWIARYRYGD